MKNKVYKFISKDKDATLITKENDQKGETVSDEDLRNLSKQLSNEELEGISVGLMDGEAVA